MKPTRLRYSLCSSNSTCRAGCVSVRGKWKALDSTQRSDEIRPAWSSGDRGAREWSVRPWAASGAPLPAGSKSTTGGKCEYGVLMTRVGGTIESAGAVALYSGVHLTAHFINRTEGRRRIGRYEGRVQITQQRPSCICSQARHTPPPQVSIFNVISA
jgi:hypothetical protein